MSALVLKLLACVTMLLDHIGYMTNNSILRVIGRLAFPIFLYLIYNGYKHTASVGKYALRLGLFALISQIPFCLFCYNVPFRNHWNVFLTLLLALLAVWSADRMKQHKLLRWFSFAPALLLFFLAYKEVFSSDYDSTAMILIMIFFYLDGSALWKRIATVVLYLCAIFHAPLLQAGLSLLRGEGLVLPTLTSWQRTQAWSVLALLPIFCYNGKKGSLPAGKGAARIFQFAFYAFYPVHLMVLWLIGLLQRL